MGANDSCQLLKSIDHWAETGLLTQLSEACCESHCPVDVLDRLRACYREQTGLTPGSGPVWRGLGWRVWYRNGTWLDSRTTPWVDVPDGIVLGVSYHGYRRWMAHGVDPYWLGEDGLLYDSRHAAEDEHMQRVMPALGARKMGVYVTDEEMRACRLQAALAFIF